MGLSKTTGKSELKLLCEIRPVVQAADDKLEVVVWAAAE